ncbi:MAG: biotin/lipoyl-binding protein, partial [Planctomycetota bacterium]
MGATPVGRLGSPDLVSSYRGIVIPRREADLAFRRSGRIESLNVDAGDSVKRGAVLGVLDIADLKASYAVAKSELAVARAEYEEALAGPRNQTIRAAEARVAQLAAQELAARKRLDRRRQLSRTNASSEEELENETYSVARLKANVDEAKSQLEELREGTRREQIEAARSRVEMAKASLELIRVQLADSRLVAPFDCLVGTRFLDEGAMASPNTATLSVIETPPLEARFGLPS